MLRALTLALTAIGCSSVLAGYRHEVHGVKVAREAASWVSDWTEVVIPTGLQSLQILVWGSGETMVQVTDLVDPSGRVYVRSSTNDKLSAYSQPVLNNMISANRSEGVVPGFGTLLVPNNPSLPAPMAGTWRVRTLSHHEPVNKQVDILFVGKSKLGGGAKARIWLASGSFWSGKSKEYMDELLAGAQSVLQAAGVELNVLNRKIITAQVPASLEVPVDMAALALATNDPSVINIYLMGAMDFQTKPVNGMACIGGPADTGRAHPCFVSLYAKADADILPVHSQSLILAHEIGHYLGLFHTRGESPMVGMGPMLDPLEDTPAEVTGLNIMDPGAHTPGSLFSPQQQQMMQLSPALQ